MTSQLTKLRKVIGRKFVYLVRFRGNKIAYLRYLGARIGEDCAIYTTIGNFGSEPWLIEIGNHVMLASGVVLMTHDGSSRLFRDRFSDMNARYGNRFGTITIHDDSFVGLNSIIVPNITIGPDSLVGTGSVVTKNVEPNTVVAGNPARFICSMDEYVERYRAKMIPVMAQDRESLRRELTTRLWGEIR